MDSTLKVTCGQCEKVYQIPLEKLRKAVHHATCTRCGQRLTILRPDAAPISSRRPSPERRGDLPSTPTPEPKSPVSSRSVELKPSPRVTPERESARMRQVRETTLLSTFEREPIVVPAFYLDLTPVTNAQYQRFVDDTGHRPPLSWASRKPAPQLLDHPVVDVSFEDARQYARFCNKRLPTDVEWQAAARGPDNRRFPWGNDWDPAKCACPESGASGTVKVASYESGAAACGCLHLLGNVWEWTEPDPRSKPPEEGYRWVFGGSYCHACNTDALPRNAVSVHKSYRYLGFRCSADL